MYVGVSMYINMYSKKYSDTHHKLEITVLMEFGRCYIHAYI